MGRSNLIIIIPAKNESKTIKRVIKYSIKFGTVLVVDDGSTDGTGTIAIKNGADRRSLQIRSSTQNGPSPFKHKGQDRFQQRLQR